MMGCFLSQKYLKQYNYISSIPKGNKDIKTALEIFQRFMHLPVTGLLDNTTLHEMAKKRCGVPDVDINDSSLGKRLHSNLFQGFANCLTFVYMRTMFLEQVQVIK